MVAPPLARRLSIRTWRRAAAVLVATMVCTASTPAVAGQWLLGTVCIHSAVGQRIYGEYLTVFLTTAPITVPSVKAIDAGPSHGSIKQEWYS